MVCYLCVRRVLDQKNVNVIDVAFILVPLIPSGPDFERVPYIRQNAKYFIP